MQPQELNWIGGQHLFMLSLGNLRALQKVCDAGPHEVLLRLRGTVWRVDDLYETLRQGLIGGGMSVSTASELLTKLFNQHPLHEFKEIASVVLLYSLVGDDESGDDDEGKPEGVTPQPPENGDFPRSMEREQ